MKVKKLRNRVVSLLRKEKRESASADLAKGINPWKVADKLLGKEENSELPIVHEGREIREELEKAELMNKFFQLSVFPK